MVVVSFRVDVVAVGDGERAGGWWNESVGGTMEGVAESFLSILLDSTFWL